MVVAVALAGVISYLATPVAIRAAHRLAFYDIPVGYKGHQAPTPYLGGAAVVVAFAVALLVAAPSAPGRTLVLLAGTVGLFVLGTIDDRRTVSPQLRLAVEFALGVLLSASGHGWQLGAGPAVDAVVNGVWVVAVVNAFNLFDNMDGAASAMAIVAAAGACALGWLHEDAWAVATAAALCGACVGFLPHNLARPSRIFLGDGGSLPLGFVVAAVVASTAHGAEPSVLGLFTGMLLVGLPAIDTCLVIVSRRRRGISILTGGQDHLTHRTRKRVLTARRVALVLGSVQVLLSALVIVATREGSVTLVYALLAYIVCASVAIVGLEQATTEADPSPGPATTARIPPERSVRWRSVAAAVAVTLLGLGAGLSPFFGGYYDNGVWVPIGLVLTLAAAAAAVLRPPRITWPAVLAFAGVAGLGLWSLISTTWAHGVEAASVAANRWLTYAALLLLALVLVRTRRHAALLLTGAGIGVGVVAATVLIRMLGGDPAALFLGGRLNAPLGYINGEGAAFAMSCWFGLALAERREPLLAGLGAAATVALACLTLLSQSRGAAIASFVAVLVALAVIPGRVRRVLALAVVAAGVAAASAAVVNVYSVGEAGGVTASAAHHAALAILGSAALVGIAWAAAVGLGRAVENRGPDQAASLHRVATVLAILVVAAPIATAVVRSATIERTVRQQWNAFVHLSDAGSSSPGAAQTRLFSGAGNRYDYWRIAWHAFTAHPLVGVGAGNYAESYYRDRQTLEAIENPHSLELQTLSELGLIGALLLTLALAGVAVGAARMRRLAQTSLRVRATMVAALGATIVWLVDTSGDWMHLIPGVTAIAILSVAAICQAGALDPAPADHVRPPGDAAASAPRRSIAVLIGAGAVAFVLAISGACLLRAALVRVYLHDARAELSSHPTKAITDAGRALRLDGGNLDAYYVKAAGQARLNEAPASRATLRSAAAEDPENFVTWTLLGDLEVRLHNFGAASAFYGRAHALDPHDPTIAALAAHPENALPASNPD
jgi:UDP-GlcNAc:undecaprenyl-phosphate GlcNAc-1-phosphate transferase